MQCADRTRLVHPLYQGEDGGSRPTSALQLRFVVIDLDKARSLNRLWHSRFPAFGGGGSRVCYAAGFDGLWYAVAIWTNPSSPKLPQRAWLILKRWTIAPDAPRNTASRMDGWMFRDLRKRFPEAVMAITYSDPDVHHGGIYRACSWTEGETTTRKTVGRLQWHIRERGRVAVNEPCSRVTRWTKAIRTEVD